MREPHCWSRGDLLRLTHPVLGEIVTQGIVPALSRTLGRVGLLVHPAGLRHRGVAAELLGFAPERDPRARGRAAAPHDPLAERTLAEYAG